VSSSVLRPRQHSIGYMGDGFRKNNTSVMKFILTVAHNQLPSMLTGRRQVHAAAAGIARSG